VRNFTFFCLVFITCLASTFAQTPQQIAVQITATVMDVPPRITLNWSSLPTITQYQIFRKLKSENSWGSVITSIPGTSVQYIDNNVQQNISYEYKIVGSRTNGVNAVGYINAGIKLSETANRGKLFLLIDNRFQNSLAPEIARLEKDLEGEGWIIIKNYYPINASVTDIKNFITQNYFQDPQNTKAVFLLGHIPVPYSGNIYPDGHSDHEGAWPADVFYGDMDGTWTDLFVDLTVASSSRNHNVPGDGKFDQWSIPTDIELQVGRVDLYGLSAFSQNEETLLRNYLNKDHNYRIKQFAPIKRALIDDNFGYFGGEAFSASAMRNFASLVGTSNIAYTDYISSMQSGSYLWSYGCGGGTYTSANGIGSTNDFSNVTLQGVFSGLFGSYFGDWDRSNALLKSTIANGNVLSTVWSGRPNWIFHHMALGENIGYSAKITQNNNGLYASNYGARFIHLALLGDPTLKNDVVSPVSNVIASKNGNNCIITWVPSSDNVIGYNIYSKNQENTTYAKLNSSPITLNNFTDSCLIYPGIYSYMVRAVKLETTASGTYYNLSTGIIDTAANSQNLLIDADFSFNVSNNTVSFIGLINNATNFLWDFDNGLNSTNINPVVNFNDGLYNVKLIVEKSCNSDTIQKMVGVGNLFPAQPGNFVSYTDSICAATNNVIFSVPSVANVNYSWSYSGSGATINGSGNSVSINFSANASSGTLSVTPTNFFGPGLPRELQIYIKPVPNVTISGENSICSGTSTNLIANGASTYLWQGGSTENYITVSPSVTTSYNVIGTSSNGCSKASSVSVNVTSTPALPSISILSGSNPFCFGSSVTLRSSSLNGNLWSSGATTRDVTLDSTNTLTLQVIVNGCSSLVNTITVTEKPQLIAEISNVYNDNFTTCELAMPVHATENLNYPSSITYQWTFPNTQVTYGISQIANQTGNYILKIIPADFCPIVQTSQQINVGIGSSPSLLPNGPTTICEGGVVVLNAPAGGSYMWSNGSTSQSIVVTQEGNYFVEIFSGPCSGVSDSVYVDVTELVVPSVTIETPSLSICNSDVVVFNSITSDAGINPIFSWKKNGIVVGNTNVYIDSTLQNNDQIQCEIFTSNVCTNFPNVSSNIITVNVSSCNVIWTGAEDSNWDNINNWMPQQIPNFERSVIINAGTPNSPELRTTSACFNLNIKSGAIIELSRNIFQVYGQIFGNGKLSGGGNSELHLFCQGNVGGISFFQQNEYSKSLANLYINCGNVYLKDTLYITEAIKLQTGFLETKNKLRLRANSKKSAVIKEVSSPEECAIIGDVIVERFARGGLTGWATIGNPVKNEKIVGWHDDFATAGFPGAVGVAGNFVSVYWYDETTEGDLVNGYTIPSSSTDTVPIGRGYMVYLGDGFTNTNNIIYDVVGEVQIGEFQIPVTYTTTENNVFSNVDGWNLVANPYCHTIDWDSEDWVTDNIDKSIYIYNADIQNYSTYIRNSDGIGINGGTNNIAAGQGFWIKANAENPYLLATERIKRTNNIELQRNSNDLLPDGLLKLKLVFGNKTDETILWLKQEASNNYDGEFDAIKLNSLNNDYPNISSKMEGINYAINTVSSSNIPDEVLLKLKVSSIGNYQIEFKGVETFASNLYLKDNSNQNLLKLTIDTTLNFLVVDTLNFLYRYSLVFNNGNVLKTENTSLSRINIFPNPSKNKLKVIIPTTRNIISAELFDSFGRIIEKIDYPSKNIVLDFNAGNLNVGIYYLKFIDANGSIESYKWIKNQ